MEGIYRQDGAGRGAAARAQGQGGMARPWQGGGVQPVPQNPYTETRGRSWGQGGNPVVQNTGGQFVPQAPSARQQVAEDAPVSPRELSPQLVMKAIPGSIGSVDYIARKLRVDRVKLRRFISEIPELVDALEDEKLAAREQILEQTYNDAMAGSPQARQDFYKMTGGSFDKRESSDTADRDKVVIMMGEPMPSFKMKTEDGGLVDVDRDLNEIGGGGATPQEGVEQEE